MRQSFDETADPAFGREHVPLIRKAMADQGLDAFVAPHEDEHQNEYLPAANDRLAWATGFTGSAGAAVILADKAAIFVDGRYALQVRDQVDGEVFEVREFIDGRVGDYIREVVPAGSVVGYDPRLMSPQTVEKIAAAATEAGAVLRAVQENPVDVAWGASRPPQPAAPVVPHPLQYAGEDSAAKRARLGEGLAKTGAQAALITAPASIAWLFNIRGGDVIRSPLPLARAILEADGRARLFLDPRKVTGDLRAWLGNEVRLESPDDFEAALGDFAGRGVLVDPTHSSAWCEEALKAAGALAMRGEDPCVLPKARKNEVEIAGARRAHERDGVALAGFLHWVATAAQETLPDELEVVATLEAFREETGALKDLSFDTIAGAMGNGAICHYHPSRRMNRRTQPGSLLLVDSGAQFLDGTTDVTRTMAMGAPSPEMAQRFTLVLQGHLALARARFPAGTTGPALDALARLPLWAAGLDYDHGTGHGVGSYLSVHEGPQRIGKVANAVALEAGMIVSNEPGYYKAGSYGIRIENLEVVVGPEPIEGGERPMLRFETLTLAPIDRRLIVREMLGDEERAQLDAYHARVLSIIGPKSPADVAAWLEEACAPI